MDARIGYRMRVSVMVAVGVAAASCSPAGSPSTETNVEVSAHPTPGTSGRKLDAEARLDRAIEILRTETSPRIAPTDIAMVAGELVLESSGDELDLLDADLTIEQIDPVVGSLFVDGAGTTNAGWALLATLDEANGQGIELDPDRVQRLIDMASMAAPDPEHTTGRLALTQKHRHRLIASLVETSSLLPPDELALSLVRPSGPLSEPGLRAQYDRRKADRDERVLTLAQTEVAMVDLALRYATVMSPGPAGVRRIGELFRQVAENRGSFEGARRTFRNLEPQSVEYAALREAYQAYLGLPPVAVWGVVAFRVAQIRLNLQRIREMSVDRNQTYVLINAASGQGSLVRNGDRILAFDVGRDHDAPLPVFSSDIDRLTVEPSGVVRFHIAGQKSLELCGGLEGSTDCRRLLRQTLSIDQPGKLADRLLELTGKGNVRVAALAAAPRSTRVDINPGVPVHVVYLTATADTGHDVVFHEDLDGRDDALWASVAQGPPVDGTL